MGFGGLVLVEHSVSRAGKGLPNPEEASEVWVLGITLFQKHKRKSLPLVGQIGGRR